MNVQVSKGLQPFDMHSWGSHVVVWLKHANERIMEAPITRHEQTCSMAMTAMNRGEMLRFFFFLLLKWHAARLFRTTPYHLKRMRILQPRR